MRRHARAGGSAWGATMADIVASGPAGPDGALGWGRAPEAPPVDPTAHDRPARVADERRRHDGVRPVHRRLDLPLRARLAGHLAARGRGSVRGRRGLCRRVGERCCGRWACTGSGRAGGCGPRSSTSVRRGVLLGLVAFSALFVVKLPDVSRLFLLTLFVAQIALTVASRAGIRWLLQVLRERGLQHPLHARRGHRSEGAALRRRDRAPPRAGAAGHRLPGRRARAPTMIDHRPGARGHSTTSRTSSTTTSSTRSRSACRARGLTIASSRSPGCARRRARSSASRSTTCPVSLPGGRVEEFDGARSCRSSTARTASSGLVVKRLLDVGLAGLGARPAEPAVRSSSPLAIVALDGRPILFRQTRVGLHGRPFSVVKFRTMVPDAEERLAELEELNEIKGHAFKVTNDPRLTPDRRRSCARRASTSCPSSGTCCAAR